MPCMLCASLGRPSFMHRSCCSAHTNLPLALQVLFPDGRSEVLSRRDALKAATSLKLDLVEFAGTTADPPIVKIADYRSLRNQRRKAHEEEVQRVKEKTAASAARRASAAAASSSSSGSGSGEAASGEKQQSRAAGAVRAAAKEPGQQQSAGGKGGAATSAAAGVSPCHASCLASPANMLFASRWECQV